MPSLIDRIERVPVGSLKLHPQNARKGNVPMIAQSLAVNMQYQPLVVQASTRHVLSGNHTLVAARELGWPEVDVVLVDVDDDHAKRIMLSANRTSDLATYDDQLLLELLADLPDLDGTGYDPGDIEELEKALHATTPPEPGNTDPDDVPDIPTLITTKPGDLWLLGPHRLYCGDATNQTDLATTIGDVPPGVVYSDPPYGINAVPKDGGASRGNLAPAQAFDPVSGDTNTDTARDVFHLLATTYPQARHVWWGANHYAASAGLPDSSCWLVWDKENGGTDFADVELAWTNHSGAARQLRHMWNGMLRASERGKRVHPTQKPVALAVWAFDQIHADPTSPVLDVFAGSGSTLIAAHQTGRTAILMEIEPAYCDVIMRRYQEHTDVVPVLESTGQPHDFTSPWVNAPAASQP
ncbi:MAG: DNA methyltransferase [Pseudonocardiaceae bacterium]